MRKIGWALWTALAVALLSGYGCDSSTTPLPVFVLDGKTYVRKSTCNDTSVGAPDPCPVVNVTDVIKFQYTGGHDFEVRNVPDTGFVGVGTLTGMSFQWTATGPSPVAETSSGTWTFVASGAEFSGPSQYTAVAPGTATGECNTNGLIGNMNDPADPPPPAGCP